MAGQSMKERLKSAGARLRMERAEGEEMLAMAGTSAGIGWLEASGRMDDVPKLFGLPRTVTLAAAAYALERFGSGSMANMAKGAKNSASSVAIYQYFAGRTVSGAPAVEGRRRRPMAPEAERLEREIAKRRALERGTDVDPELAEAERELAAAGL